MTKTLVFLFFMLSCQFLGAQIPEPATWTFSSEPGKNGETNLIFHLKLKPEWHMYSQHTTDGGPLPAVFSFDSSACYQRIGEVLEPAPIEAFDSLFGVKVMYFEKEVVFTQKIKTSAKDCTIKGKIDYQACKEACILFTHNFVFTTGTKK